MTRTQARAKAKKLFGAKARIEVDEGAKSADARSRASAELATIRATQKEANEALQARIKALTENDFECCRLRKELKKLRKAQDAAAGIAHRHKFSVGRDSSMFFHVEGYGDTWEEAFAMAEQRRAENAQRAAGG